MTLIEKAQEINRQIRYLYTVETKEIVEDLQGTAELLRDSVRVLENLIEERNKIQ